ncbi:unnamed protein product, partial [Effrenium voratum]
LACVTSTRPWMTMRLLHLAGTYMCLMCCTCSAALRCTSWSWHRRTRSSTAWFIWISVARQSSTLVVFRSPSSKAASTK